MRGDMKKTLLGLLAGGGVGRTYSTSYEEGRDLLQKVVNKISDKYKLSILCLATRDSEDNHSMAVLRLNPVLMATFINSILSEAKISKEAIKLIPDKVWAKVLRKRYPGGERIFWMLLGGAGFALLYNIAIFLKQHWVG